MKQIVLVISVTISLYGYCTKKYFIDLKPDSIPFKSLGFKIVSVEDKRIDKDNIGYTMKGVFNTNRPIDFRNGLENTMNLYMSSLTDNNSTSKPIKIFIKKLFITEEEYGIQQIGTCHLMIDYFDIEGALLYTTDYDHSFLAFDLTKNNESIVKFLIKKSFLAFDIYLKSNSNSYYDIFSSNHSYNPILLCDKPKKGFYANLNELQANNPSLQFDYDFTKFEGKGTIYSKVNIKSIDLDSNLFFSMIYGFSDGDHVYINKYSSTFIQIQLIGRYCYIGKKYDSQGIPVIFPYIIGVVSVPYLQDYIMNISSGKEHALTDETLKIILASDNELYNRYIKQPFEKREEMGLIWLKEFNKRYLEKVKKYYQPQN